MTPQPNQSQLTSPEPVIDGFLFNPKLLYAPNRYLPLALEGLMPYRNYKYQPRYYTAPPDPRVAIDPGLTVDTQLRIVPGSVIVGARFATLGGVAASSVKYLIRDSDTQQNFTDGKSRYINCQSLVPTGASGAPFSIFARPYLVTGSGNDDGGGVIVVSLTNISMSTPVKCQLLLVVLEPAQIVTTQAYGSVMVPQNASTQGKT